MTASLAPDPGTSDRPGYDQFRQMLEVRGPLAAGFARQILETTRPFLPAPAEELTVLDVGCGYGHTALELARRCRRVVGIEPSKTLAEAAFQLKEHAGQANLEFRHQDLYELAETERYDLVVLDNVFEHLPDQPRALEMISACLKPKGVAFLLMPNKLWPIEPHYFLPFLSYLPLRLANGYLRLTGRGTDYTDASYAPTYFRLNRLLRARKELSFQYVLPADVSLAMAGRSWHYRLGVAALRRFPWLWAISKAFLVVAVKR
jgi:2-polyprenyl-3-methyl-5-hydroxy-6-metoxy-1,4-benzoquinol methylase